MQILNHGFHLALIRLVYEFSVLRVGSDFENPIFRHLISLL